jgi:hypothetical protein
VTIRRWGTICRTIKNKVPDGLPDVEAERNLGATDLEIHDTVLIAAAFCMYNRYVDDLATWQPQDDPLCRWESILPVRAT